MVDSCHKDDFCREDYICQAMPYQLKGVDSTRGKEIYDKGIYQESIAIVAAGSLENVIETIGSKIEEILK